MGVEILTVPGNLTELGLVRRILQELRTSGFYRPDLLYSAFCVDEAGLERFRESGTYKTAEKQAERVQAAIEVEAEVFASLRETRHRKFWEGQSIAEFPLWENSIDHFWALPQSGIRLIIAECDVPNEAASIPMVAAYKPEFLVRSFDPAYKFDGLMATEIPKAKLADPSFARYRIKDGSKPLDAIAVALRIPPPQN